MKIFNKGTEEYGILISRTIKQLEHSLKTDKLCNEERLRVHTIIDFIKLYGTANTIDKRGLDMIMRTSFKRTNANTDGQER